jgi:6-phosphogluconolactonase (cycloisomerase 2 family)
MKSLRHTTAALVAATAAIPLLAFGGQAESFLYTSSNAAAGNSVLQIAQSESGALSIVAEYATGGAGTDGGLGNQGAIAIDGEHLFVVNAGSNDITAFRILDQRLERVGSIDSGGIRPVSLTADRGVLYVVNAGTDNIAGFEIADDGALSVLPGSSQPLSGTGTGPAQISFSQNGRVLIVTEKATNRVVTFNVDRRGVAHSMQAFDSPGQTPFGFAIGNGGRLFVSEAAGGAPGQSSVTAWRVSPHGVLTVLDPAEPTLQTAACWVVVTPNGRFAYTTNTASGSVSAYRLRGGELALLDPDGNAADTGAGSAPIDMGVSPDGRYLSTLNSGTDSIATFRIGQGGDLEPVGTLVGLPASATGLVAD